MMTTQYIDTGWKAPIGPLGAAIINYLFVRKTLNKLSKINGSLIK